MGAEKQIELLMKRMMKELKNDPENAEDLYERLTAIVENSPASRKIN